MKRYGVMDYRGDLKELDTAGLCIRISEQRTAVIEPLADPWLGSRRFSMNTNGCRRCTDTCQWSFVPRNTTFQ